MEKSYLYHDSERYSKHQKIIKLRVFDFLKNFRRKKMRLRVFDYKVSPGISYIAFSISNWHLIERKIGGLFLSSVFLGHLTRKQNLTITEAITAFCVGLFKFLGL